MSQRNKSKRPSCDRRIRTERYSYHDAPYKRYSRQGFSQGNLCQNYKRPGHYARECPDAPVCNKCDLPGHIATECTIKSLCWKCHEPGHMLSDCTNDVICNTCGKAGHYAEDCTAPALPQWDMRLCNNCYKHGHIAAECTNGKACKNCRMTGHLARDCQNEPICNLCNISGHVARSCPKAKVLGDGLLGVAAAVTAMWYAGTHQVGHMSRDCWGQLICHNCGGRGHQAFECPSSRFMDRGRRRY